MLSALLLVSFASALQPPPRAPPPRAQPSLTARRYLAATPTLSVRACGASSGQAQTFTLDAATGALALADGRCLLRSASSPGGVTAGACDGGVYTSWSLAPCRAAGCAGNESLITSAVDGRVMAIPGAVGPGVAIWTLDDPTGACHNELWAWSAADATLRSLCRNRDDGGPSACPPGPPILNACLTVVDPPPPPPPCTRTPRVACHAGVWDAAPTRTPSNAVVDAPLLGNGDLGAGLATAANGTAAVWWLGKSDMWGTNTAVDQPIPQLHADTFYTAIGAGSVAVAPLLPAAEGASGFAATQDLATASVTATLSPPGLNITLAATISADENTLVSRLSFESKGVALPVLFNVTVAQATAFQLPLSAGVHRPPPLPWAIWAAKSGVAATHNSLLLMPCATDTFVIAPSTNTWKADAGTRRLRLANGTAAPLCPALVNATQGKISIDACGVEGGATDWRLVAASASAAPPGALQLRRAGGTDCAWASPPAFHNSGGVVSVGPCASQAGAWWAWEEGAGLLRYNATQCLTAVPPNVNVTVAVAVTVFLAADLSPVALVAAEARGAAATATVALLPNTDYLLIIAAPTTRDVGDDVLAGAFEMLARFAGAPTYAAERAAAHAEWWAAYYAASEVYLGEGRQLLEGFYYGSQYLLGSTARAGKVPPGLWGVFNFLDESAWNGDFTLDYNAQANFYGACSSNHCDLILPYCDTVGSEWHLDVARKRANASWRAKGSAGGPGQTAQSMGCAHMDAAWEDPHICPNTTAGHYKGLEMTTHIGPFPGLYYFADLSQRQVAAMSAMPFVEYADYTADGAFLAQRAYPLVKEVVAFFLSYVTPNPATGALDILQSCAQEICSGGPDGENNPHHDLAFVAAMLRALLRWSAQLGADADERPVWQHLLDHLAPLPTGTHANGTVWLEADDTQGFFLSNAAGYTIVYYAALHPAQVVSLSSGAEALETAWNTVTAVNTVAEWHPVNGLCMAWPPATRCAGAARAAFVLDAFEGALRATMHDNFYPDVGGGGVEQFGATEAVNSALLQSQEGFLRFFPMWPPGENATFATLRARGAFLVSASFSLGAAVAPLSIAADGVAAAPRARNCSLLDPWAPPAPPWLPPVVRDAAGGAVGVLKDPAWPELPVWVFAAEAGGTYRVWPHAG